MEDSEVVKGGDVDVERWMGERRMGARRLRVGNPGLCKAVEESRRSKWHARCAGDARLIDRGSIWTVEVG